MNNQANLHATHRVVPFAAASSARCQKRAVIEAAIGVALAFGVAELSCRYIYWSPARYHPHLGYIRTHDATITFRTEGSGLSHWTEEGIRRTGSAPDHQTGRTAPLVILGDSFTEALQVNDDQTYAAVTQEYLGRAEMPHAVLNFAESGNSVADYVALAPYVRERFQPAWVVIQISELDLEGEAWDDNKATFYRDQGTGELRVRPARYDSPGQRGAAWRMYFASRNRSAFLQLCYQRVASLREWFQKEPPLFRSATLRNQRPTAVNYPIEEELDAVSKAFDGRVTLVYTTPFYVPERRNQSSLTDARVESWAERSRCSFVKLSPIYLDLVQRGIAPNGFNNTRPFEGHLNAAGHRVVAETLAQELIRLSQHGLF